jgi:hypothetical protein
MKSPSLRSGICVSCAAALLLAASRRVDADQIAAQQVMDAIERGKRAVLKAQDREGSWSGAAPQHPVGATSLALLALLNTGMTAADPEIQRGLEWLRKQ